MDNSVNLTELKLDDLVKRFRDMRLSMVLVANDGILRLLEEIERRLSGGQPLTPLDQMSKIEQDLRKKYEFHKEWAATRKLMWAGDSRYVEPYEEWKFKHLKHEREERKKTQEENKYKNEVFQYKMESYQKRKEKFDADDFVSLTERAEANIRYELYALRRNKKSRQMLADFLQMNKAGELSPSNKVLYWLITRPDQAKKMKKK